MKLKDWIKKNIFYEVLVLFLVLAISGYLVWLLQPIPLVDEGASDIYIAMSSQWGEPSDRFLESGTTFHTQKYALSAEGEQKLIEELKSCSFRYGGGYDLDRAQIVEKDLIEIRLGVVYKIDGVVYHRLLHCYEDFGYLSSNVFVPEGIKAPLRPDVNKQASARFKLTDEDCNRLCSFVAELVKNYGTMIPQDN